MTGSGIRSGHVGHRLGTGVSIRTGGIHGIVARWLCTGIVATVGIIITPTARSAMLRNRVRTIRTCVTPFRIVSTHRVMQTDRSVRVMAVELPTPATWMQLV